MKTETEKIISLLQHTFEKDAWHGPAVKEVLNGVTEKTALNRLPDTHSIIELVAHMTAWRTFTIKKLEGDDTYQVTDALNFPDVRDWPEALRELEASQALLLKAVEKFPEEKLSAIVPGHPYNYYTLIHGIIHHDLYHTGQVMLIRKACLR
jgi:uncharacterized damage-inducible protein DinB